MYLWWWCALKKHSKIGVEFCSSSSFNIPQHIFSACTLNLSHRENNANVCFINVRSKWAVAPSVSNRGVTSRSLLLLKMRSLDDDKQNNAHKPRDQKPTRESADTGRKKVSLLVAPSRTCIDFRFQPLYYKHNSFWHLLDTCLLETWVFAWGLWYLNQTKPKARASNRLILSLVKSKHHTILACSKRKTVASRHTKQRLTTHFSLSILPLFIFPLVVLIVLALQTFSMSARHGAL